MLTKRGIEKEHFTKGVLPEISQKPALFATRSIIFACLVSLLYLLFSFLLIGIRTDQLILVGLFNLCYFGSQTSRRFILGFSIFIIYWVIFDSMKAYPNYKFNAVNIETLYQAEKSIFGIPFQNTVLTPNEYLFLHNSTLLDIITGFCYLCWVPVPLAFAAFLFFRNKKVFFQFSLTFFLVNLIGFIGYYTYPAAPPWYVAEHGFGFEPATPGSPAGFIRFDNYFNISVFRGMYAKSSNVFAAMPSMHAAFLLIVLFYGLKLRMGAWNIFFAAILVGIWFGAVYSGHHYVLDILAGIACALLAIFLLQFWSGTKKGKKVLASLVAVTSK